MPHASRSISVVADQLATVWPHGLTPEPLNVASRTTGAGDPLDREVAVDLEGGSRHVLDAGALEQEFGVVAGAEEVVGAEVLVALLVAGVDAVGVDREVDLALGRVLRVGDDFALEGGEPALDGGEHHVLDGELDDRVARIDPPDGLGGDGRFHGPGSSAAGRTAAALVGMVAPSAVRTVPGHPDYSS
jgi:hypothetical protein